MNGNRLRVNFICTSAGIISTSACSTTSIATVRKQFFQIFVMHFADLLHSFIVQKVCHSWELYESVHGGPAASDSGR